MSLCACGNCNEKRPLLGLEDFRTHMCLPEYFFWQQCQDCYQYPNSPLCIDPTTTCDELVYERMSTGGKIAGRAEIWYQIKKASDMFTRLFVDRTGYFPTPQYSCDEIVYGPPAQRPNQIRLENRRLITLGREKLDLLGTVDIKVLDGSDPAYFSDENYDGIWDSLIFQFATNVPTDQIAVFIEESEQAYDDLWRNEIREVRVKELGGGVVEITIPTWILMRPKVLTGLQTNCYDPNDLSSYVDNLSIFRRWTDPTGAITIFRRSGCCTETQCLSCEDASACVIDYKNSVMELTVPSCGCSTSKHASCGIEKICVCYLSGESCLDLTDTLARLVSANICKNVCCMENTEVAKWQQDLVGVDDRGNLISPLIDTELSNPFGTRVGQIEAWRFLNQFKKSFSAPSILFS